MTEHKPAETNQDALRAALTKIIALETTHVHCGYDDGPGGGNYVYRDVIFADEAHTIAREALAALPQEGAAVAAEPFQARVDPWGIACFKEVIWNDKLERDDRFLEEVLELLQSGDYPVDRVAALTRYVFGRSKGEPSQETGGVMVTLAARSLAYGIDMHNAGETELARIWTKVDAIRAKQAAKPTGSALPIAAPAPSPAAGVDAVQVAVLAEREDAERWRALMSSARMHWLGSAGFDVKNPDGSKALKGSIPTPRPGESWHFGMDFWSDHEAAGEDDFERRLITNYVDAIRRRPAP